MSQPATSSFAGPHTHASVLATGSDESVDEPESSTVGDNGPRKGAHGRPRDDHRKPILRRDKRARIVALCGRCLRSTVRTGQITGDIDEPGPDASAFWSAGVWVWWN